MNQTKAEDTHTIIVSLPIEIIIKLVTHRKNQLILDMHNVTVSFINYKQSILLKLTQLNLIKPVKNNITVNAEYTQFCKHSHLSTKY
jgi:hypothetical protein